MCCTRLALSSASSLAVLAASSRAATKCWCAERRRGTGKSHLSWPCSCTVGKSRAQRHWCEQGSTWGLSVAREVDRSMRDRLACCVAHAASCPTSAGAPHTYAQACNCKGTSPPCQLTPAVSSQLLVRAYTLSGMGHSCCTACCECFQGPSSTYPSSCLQLVQHLLHGDVVLISVGDALAHRGHTAGEGGDPVGQVAALPVQGRQTCLRARCRHLAIAGRPGAQPTAVAVERGLWRRALAGWIAGCGSLLLCCRTVAGLHHLQQYTPRTALVVRPIAGGIQHRL